MAKCSYSLFSHLSSVMQRTQGAQPEWDASQQAAKPSHIYSHLCNVFWGIREPSQAWVEPEMESNLDSGCNQGTVRL